jgi:chromosomal replication initiation ATPase DnaA
MNEIVGTVNLLGSLQQAIKKVGVKKITDMLDYFSKAKNNDKSGTSELIVKTICQHFGISRSALMKSEKASGEIYTALIFLTVLLKKYSMTSQKEISVFTGKSPAMIHKYLSDFNTMQMTLTKIDKSNLLMFQNLDEKINNYLNK